MGARRDVIAVIDIGKSNVRVCAVDENGRGLGALATSNRVVSEPPYPHFDTDGLFGWIVAALRELAAQYEVRTIVSVAHGACAALVGARGLVLPVLDYEFEGVGEIDREYDAAARDFAHTASPRLPVGLNLGRQLYWLSRRYPGEFARATIIPYPQYWGWSLTGVRACEATSLGCHTDLWEPRAGEFSQFAHAMGWDAKFARRCDAWTPLGPPSAEVAAAAGVSRSCTVLAGIHDSNASYFAYRGARDDRFSVVSTGTWVVAMSRGASLDLLREERDTLANVDAFGEPLATARFMGGREYEAIAGPVGLGIQPTMEDFAQVVRAGTLVLPAFSTQGGPFRRSVGRFIGPPPADARSRAALASLYCGLMTDMCLDFIDARGDVIVDGPLARNAVFTSALAALRSPQRMLSSADEVGTLRGAAMLAAKSSGTACPAPSLDECRPADVGDVREVRARWRSLIPEV
jgi:L-fuculokinase